MPINEQIVGWLREAAAEIQEWGILSRYDDEFEDQVKDIVKKFKHRAAQVESMTCEHCRW